MSEDNLDSGGEHWSNTFESDSITADNRDAFVTANSKYATEHDAVVGGYNAQKLAGRPFNMTEHMEKLPDDASRAEFQSQAKRDLGINVPKSVEDLKDFNFKEGLAEGVEPDENLVGMIKEFAVESGMDTGSLQKALTFFNGPMSKYAMETMAERDTTKFESDCKACNEALIADPDFGSSEEVEKQSVLFKRAIGEMVKKNGLDVDAGNEVVQAMVDGGLTKDPRLAKILLQAFAPMAAEGGTFSGDGSFTSNETQKSPYEAKQERWPNTPSSWGNESDKWEGESRQTKNALGYKEN